jgi:hypothetical protein
VVSAKYDMQALERSLKKAAGAFGETSAQAVIRWGVSVCRDLAVQTQAWGPNKYGREKKQGKTTWAKGQQEGAMVADAYHVILIVPKVGGSNKKGLQSAGEVNDWIELNRTRRGARTAHLPVSERKVCTEAVFKSAMRERFKRAGMAKGGWLGAGMEIAKHQTGQDRINIGKNYLSYAQKHSNKGHGVPAKSGFSPVAVLENRAAHSASKNVVSDRARRDAVAFGARKTIKWYNIALKKSLDKV